MYDYNCTWVPDIYIFNMIRGKLSRPRIFGLNGGRSKFSNQSSEGTHKSGLGFRPFTLSPAVSIALSSAIVGGTGYLSYRVESDPEFEKFIESSYPYVSLYIKPFRRLWSTKDPTKENNSESRKLPPIPLTNGNPGATPQELFSMIPPDNKYELSLLKNLVNSPVLGKLIDEEAKRNESSKEEFSIA